MESQKLLIIIFLVSLLSFLIPFPTQAGLVPCGLSQDDPSTPGIDESKPCQFCHLFVLFENIINFLIFQVVLPLAVLMIAVAGFMYIFAYINPEEGLMGKGGPALLSQAKKIFSSVILGLVIIFAAWLLVGLFFQMIGLAKWTEDIYRNWWKQGLFQINCPTESKGGAEKLPGELKGGAEKLPGELKGGAEKLPGEKVISFEIKNASWERVETKSGEIVTLKIELGEEGAPLPSISPSPLGSEEIFLAGGGPSAYYWQPLVYPIPWARPEYVPELEALLRFLRLRQQAEYLKARQLEAEKRLAEWKKSQEFKKRKEIIKKEIVVKEIKKVIDPTGVIFERKKPPPILQKVRPKRGKFLFEVEIYHARTKQLIDRLGGIFTAEELRWGKTQMFQWHVPNLPPDTLVTTEATIKNDSGKTISRYSVPELIINPTDRAADRKCVKIGGFNDGRRIVLMPVFDYPNASQNWTQVDLDNQSWQSSANELINGLVSPIDQNNFSLWRYDGLVSWNSQESYCNATENIYVVKLSDDPSTAVRRSHRVTLIRSGAYWQNFNVLSHEIGHSFAGLYDEYTQAHSGFEPQPWEPGLNCFKTDYPFLCPGDWKNLGASCYEGCNLSTSGWYRDHPNDIMRTLDSSFFGPVDAHIINSLLGK